MLLSVAFQAHKMMLVNVARILRGLFYNHCACPILIVVQNYSSWMRNVYSIGNASQVNVDNLWGAKKNSINQWLEDSFKIVLLLLMIQPQMKQQMTQQIPQQIPPLPLTIIPLLVLLLLLIQIALRIVPLIPITQSIPTILNPLTLHKQMSMKTRHATDVSTEEWSGTLRAVSIHPLGHREKVML